MKNIKATLSDKIQVIALILNIVVLIGLAIWNIRQGERIAKLEYDELAPRIVVYREVTLDLELDYAFYSWIIRNNGRTAAENTTISVYSKPEFSFGDCHLDVPFDNIQKRVSGDYILFEGLILPPQGTVLVSCSTKPGLLVAFMRKHNVFPNLAPSLNCAQFTEYDIDVQLLLPNLGITANNVEPSRIVCAKELRDIYE